MRLVLRKVQRVVLLRSIYRCQKGLATSISSAAKQMVDLSRIEMQRKPEYRLKKS